MIVYLATGGKSFRVICPRPSEIPNESLNALLDIICLINFGIVESA